MARKALLSFEVLPVARLGYSAERRRLDGAFLQKQFSLAKQRQATITQASLAKSCGVSRGVFSQWKSGETRIPDMQLLKLSILLSFDPTELRPELNFHAMVPLVKEEAEVVQRMRNMNAIQRAFLFEVIDSIDRFFVKKS